MNEIVNKVAQSGLITLDMEAMLSAVERADLDISKHLHMGLMLKEKEFREFIAENDWNQYEGKALRVFCSTDAIVPTWAYMLIATKLNDIAKFLFFGTESEFENALLTHLITTLETEEYKDARVVVKGCSGKEISTQAYIALSTKLLPHVKSLMFGEPCSTVPLYKRKS